MPAPKIRPTDYSKLYKESDKTQNLHDKQIIESLQKRLNEKIQKDVNFQKKAALIIEQWINQKKK